jgi:hypothetical protein
MAEICGFLASKPNPLLAFAKEGRYGAGGRS